MHASFSYRDDCIQDTDEGDDYDQPFSKADKYNSNEAQRQRHRLSIQ